MANISFGERLRRARIRNAMIQAELGEKVGVTGAAVSHWETGRVVPTKAQKDKLKNILGGWAEEKQQEGKNNADSDIGPSPFAAWLTKTRLEKKLSVAEVADAAGLSAAALYNIEAGRITNPRSETVRKLELALGTKLEEEVKKEIRDEATIEGFGELLDFDPHENNDLPSVAGIYVLYDISERPVYVGQASDIKRRIREHRDKFWFKSPIVHTAAYVKVEEKDLRERVETLLIRFLKSNAVINQRNVDR